MNNKYFLLLFVAHRLLFRRKTVFDLDDAVYTYAPRKAALLARMSDLVAAGSHEIAAWARRYNRNVAHLPTSLPDSWFEGPARAFSGTAEPVVVGWSGNGPAHLENLRLLVPAFEELIRRNVPFSFTLVDSCGDEGVIGLFKAVKGLRLSAHGRVAPEKMPEIVRTFTVGIMPLTDTPWSRGKCALKAIEYMACGIPALVSPVGENVQVVHDGVNGFVAGTPSAWADAIERAYRAPDVLRDMGRKARETVIERYSYRATIPKLIKLLETL